VRALTFVLALALSVSAQAQTFDDGLAEAVKLYRKAAEQGNAYAQYNLGFMYGNGEGVPQDYVEAHKWFNLAAAQGLQTAIASRDIAASKMTREQIAEAQRLAREWQAKHQGD